MAMTSSNAVKEESLRPLHQPYDSQVVKIEAPDYDGARFLLGEVPVVEISSSSSGEKSFTTAELAGEVTSPAPRSLQSKRPNPFDILHNSNGSGFATSSAKRPRMQPMDLNGRGDRSGYVEGRNLLPQLAIFNQRQEPRTPELPADFLEPLEPQRSLPIQTGPFPWMTPSPIAKAGPGKSADRVTRQFWKAGDYESDQVGKKTIGGGMDHVRVHPKFLHSNATSHKWALGAVAELLDNALDEVANGATCVNVDMIRNPKDGDPMLLIEDDGGGMNPDSMRQCMSLGYSAKSKIANTIGQYGNGFKTSTMRLGADVIVFSRCPARHGSSPSESIGILSYTFLRDTGQEDIIVPMVDYEIQPFGLRKLIRSNVDDWNRNMETIKRWSPYATEAELLDQFKDMKHQGTKIIVYNLWEDDQGQLELDFDANPHDIQVRGANRDEKNILMAERFPNSRHYLTYRHSLRSYASILYLRLPVGFRMSLRGKEVEHHSLIDDLMYTQESTYKPQGGSDQVHRETGQMKAVVTVGFVKDAKEHIDVQGFNVYHKNRLIKPFWRIWNSAASRGRGIIGVLEANFVEPAHDKQGFERTIVLARLEARLLEMQKSYWSKNCHRVGYVNNSLNKDKDGKQAYRGPSSSRADRSPETMLDAHTGPSRSGPLLEGQTPPSNPLAVSRSLRSQSHEFLRPLQQAGSNSEVQVPPVSLALARSLQSQTHEQLSHHRQLARQELEAQVPSPPLDVRSSLRSSTHEQFQRHLLQTRQRSEPRISSAATTSLQSQAHGELQSQGRQQSEVSLPVIPLVFPRGLRSHLHDRHQGRLPHAMRESAAEVPLVPLAVTRSLVQPQTRPETEAVAPLDILSVTRSLESQTQPWSPAVVPPDLLAVTRSLQSQTYEGSDSDLPQASPGSGADSDLPQASPAPNFLAIQEGSLNNLPQASPVSAAEGFPTTLVIYEGSQSDRPQSSPGSTAEVGPASLVTFEGSRSHLPQASPGAGVPASLATYEGSHGHLQRASPGSAAEVSQVSLATYEGSQSHLSQARPGSAVTASLATYEGSLGHRPQASPGSVAEASLATHEGSHGQLTQASRSAADVPPASLATYEGPHGHLQQASPGSAAAVSPASLATHEGSHSHLPPGSPAALATYEGSHSHLPQASPGLAAEDLPPLAIFEGSQSHLSQASPGSAAEIPPAPLAGSRSLQSETPEETECLPQIGSELTAEAPPVTLAGTGSLQSETNEEPQGCPSAVGLESPAEGPTVSLAVTRSIPIQTHKEPHVSVLQCRPELVAEVSPTAVAITRPLCSQTQPIPDETREASLSMSSKPEMNSTFLRKSLETDAQACEKQCDARASKTDAASSRATTSPASLKTTVRSGTDANASRVAHSVTESSPAKSSKNSSLQSKDPLFGRKSLEDLGRKFAKKAVATEKTRNGVDQGSANDTNIEPAAKVSGIATRGEGLTGMTGCCSHLSDKQLEARLADMELEVQVLQRKLETVIKERESLREQLQEERKQGQLNKIELQKKLEEAWAQIQEFEAQKNCL